MKKVMLLAILLATLNSACKKSTNPAATNTEPAGPTLFIRNNLDSLLVSPSSYALRPVISNVSGVLVSCRVSGELTDTSGISYHYRRNWQNAVFTDSVYSILVNTHPLSTDSNQVWGSLKAYFNSYNDGTWWNDADTNNWNISGITAPSFSVDMDGTMPQFTGTLPDTVSVSTDFTYNFNGSNSENADSAYVIIHTGGSFSQSKSVSAHGGLVTIHASDFHNYPSGFPELTRIDGKIFAGRPMAVVLYSHTFRTFGGKRYAFIKQRIVLKMAVITS